MNTEISKLIKIISQFSERDKNNLLKQINEMLRTNNNQDGELKVIEIQKNIESERGICCPHCKSSKIVGFGKYRDRRRYRCNSCRKTFNDLTGTPMSRTHHLEKWNGYFKCMIEGKALRTIAKELGIALQTAFDWRHKILDSFKRIECNKLEGITETDETFFLYSEKGNKQIKDRPARKRGGVAKQRGISKEQVAVITSCDRKNNMVLDVACLGRISEKDVEKSLGAYIDHNNILCTDEHNSYKAFAQTHGINHEPVNLSKGQRIKNRIYHIQNVNSCHSRLKSWMGRFHGVATKYLSNYMSWFRLLEKTKNKLEQLKELINYSLVIHKVMTSLDVHVGDTQYIRT